jgi:hypothetical protein
MDMTRPELHDGDGELSTPAERLDAALAGIAQVTDEIVVAYKEFDRLASRWSLLEAATASPRQSARS